MDLIEITFRLSDTIQNMRGIILTLSVSILMTSCATILNRPHKYMTVHTTEPSKIIYRQDTISTLHNKAHVKIERNWESASIGVVTDSLTKSVRIRSKNSIIYWSNIVFNYGIGMLVDRNNPKRYTRPGIIYINSADAKSGYSQFGKANNKGELYLHYSNPTFSLSRMIPENERTKVSIGFIGVEIGLDYYHSKNQFIHFGYSIVDGGAKRSRISNPPSPFFKLKEREFMNTAYFSISNNHKIRRFVIGYGISYAKYKWEYDKTGWYTISYILPIPLRATIDEVKKSHNAFGFVFPNYFQFGEYLYVGMVYRPTFYRPNQTDKFAYEHLIGIDLAWKIRLKR